MAKRILILVLAAVIWGNTGSLGRVQAACNQWPAMPVATFTQDGTLVIPELVLGNDVWALTLALTSVMPTIDFTVTGVAVVTDCATWFAPAAYADGVLSIPLLEIAGDYYEAAFVLSSLEPSIVFQLTGVAYAEQAGLNGQYPAYSDPYGYGAGGWDDSSYSYSSYSDPYGYDSCTDYGSGYDEYDSYSGYNSGYDAYDYDSSYDSYGSSYTDSYDSYDYYDANTTWEEDSAGYPGGAYDNPSSTYYDYSYDY